MADIFDEDELAADLVTENPEEPQTEAPSQETAPQPRDEAGRFASNAGAPEEAVADAGGDSDQPGEKARQVPQGALHAEREKHKSTKAQLEQAQQQLQAIAQLRQQIADRLPEPITSREPEDPASETAYLRQRLEQIGASQHDMQQRQQLSQLEQAEHQQLGAVLSQSEAEYRSVKPDYDAAINHVVTARAKELSLYGLGQMEISETLRQEVLDITRAAIQQGRAPAEVGYELAMLRGYRPDATQEPLQPQAGAAHRVVEAVGVAKARSRSLGQASGTGTTRDLNASTIMAMSADEFDALYSTPEGKRLIDAL